nr:immunoglobulin light chain junction region [Macaca mulatta]MOX41781.1 immunoglobulin light chain junction region [Macaca mulatta]MOX41797.1 immunoglobulin light chain junction region [Macaca mulatta]MOX41908.1 immunoglobulin light chain junction region [Macaca mulatta]MOX41974.1 immunoglobulin light chain junction region [Macaca mulatta]
DYYCYSTDSSGKHGLF